MKGRLEQRDVCEHGAVIARLDAVVCPRRPDLVPVRRPVSVVVMSAFPFNHTQAQPTKHSPLLRAIPKHEVDALVLRRVPRLHEVRPRREVACDVLARRLALQVEHLEIRQGVVRHRVLGRERRVHRYGRDLARDDLVRPRVAACALTVEVPGDDDRAARFVRFVAGAHEHERRGHAALVVGPVVQVGIQVGEADLAARAALQDEVGGRADSFCVCPGVLRGFEWRVPETKVARRS